MNSSTYRLIACVLACIFSQSILLPAQDLDEAWRLTDLGRCLMDSSEFNQAIAHLKQAASIYEAHLKEEDKTLFKEYSLCLVELGGAYNLSHAYKEVPPVLAPLLDQTSQILGKTHPMMARVQQVLGYAYGQLGDYDKAIQLSKESLTTFRRHYGNNNSNVPILLRNIGTFFSGMGQYDASVFYTKECLRIYMELYDENHPEIGMAYFNLGIIYKEIANYDSALLYTQRAVEVWKLSLPIDDPQHAYGFISIGNIYKAKGDYRNAIQFYQRGLEICKKDVEKNQPLIGDILLGLGLAQYRLGDFEAAKSSHESSLKIMLDTYGKDHFNTVKAYNNLAMDFHAQGSSNQALNYYFEALKIMQRKFGEDDYRNAIIYNNIGSIYVEQLAYDKAMEFFNKSRQIRVKTYGEKHPALLAAYISIGSLFLAKKENNSALSFFQKALHIGKTNLGEHHPSLLGIYTNIASVYRNLGFQPKALSHYQQALSIGQRVWSETHPDMAHTLWYIGQTYNELNQPTKGSFYIQKALSIQESIYKGKHPSLAQNYKQLGHDLFLDKTYSKALERYQQSLTANSPSFHSQLIEDNPSPKDSILAEDELIGTLVSKARTLLARYSQETQSVSDLHMAMATYRAAIPWIDRLRQSFQRPSDQIRLQESTHEIYQGLIQTIVLLQDIQSQDSLIHIAFEAAELSKATQLRKAWQQEAAKANSGVPDSLLRSLEDLASTTSFYEKQLYEEQLKGQKADSSMIIRYQNLVFTKKRVHDSLTQVIEFSYPAFRKLKHQDQIATISDIQMMLMEEQVLLQYIKSDSNLYVFVISEDSACLTSLPLSTDLNHLIDQYREGIYGYYTRNQKSPETLHKQYNRTAYQLYTSLLHPLQPILTHNLLIIPDAELAYVPFGALLTQPYDSSQIESEPAYLLKTHQISYGLSATMLMQMNQKKVSPTHHLLALAPSFSGPELLGEESLRSASRDYLGPLLFNQKEAQTIAHQFGGQTLLDSAATKGSFLSMAPDFRILHLSTHGFVDPANSQYSFLAFHGPADSIRLGNQIQQGVSGLYLADLHHLTLQAEMVVLSACETGLGELRLGEGIASLASGFAFAGAKSIITTLWSVNDKATSDLMQTFYQHLSEGLPKNKALRKAQLAAIEKGQAPFFWAGFVPLGDMRPIIQTTSLLWYLFLILLASMFGMLGWKNRKRISKT